MFSDRFVENLSAPSTSGISGERAPVVPGIPDLVVFSSLHVRPARTTTASGAAQNTVLITSEALSDNSLTLLRFLLKRVSVGSISSFTVLLRRLTSAFLISSLNGALCSTVYPSTERLSAAIALEQGVTVCE